MLKKQSLALSALALAATLAVPGLAGAGPAGKTAPNLIDHYLKIQTALAGDSLDSIAADATAIGKLASQVDGKTPAEALRVSAEDAAAGRALMPQIAAASAKLAQASNLKEARAAFGELSVPMVAYRDLITGDKPNVAYCPMARKNWLQDGKIIANPYYGSSMLRCGTIVAK